MSHVLVARCVRGLEWILADEIASTTGPGLPAGGMRLAPRQVSFTVPRLTRQLLTLRTADDLFLQVGTVTGVDQTRAALPVLAARLGQLSLGGPLTALRDLRDVPDKLTFDVVASLSGRRTYNRYAVEDTAGGVLGPMLGGRYVSRSAGTGDWPAGGTDLTARLFLHGTEVRVTLRAGSRPLHRRAWKVRTGPGSLHPPVAAALARIAGHPDGGVIADPFCGDGTIPVEAALADPAARVIAADLDGSRLGNARANAAAAGVRVRFLQADAGVPLLRDGQLGQVVTNPPWNRSVGAAGRAADGLGPFWRQLPAGFGRHGRVTVIADAELGTAGRLRGDGYDVTLAQGIRLAGRLSEILVATPPGTAPIPADPALAGWRQQAIRDGVLSGDGF
ncbi:MAG TPA: methyltransferase [Streptosporangiaceae bacterium]|nr:methyltransferase [Streptosporangiaceae bacterium]